MNIDDLTIKQTRELAVLFSPAHQQIDNGMIGSYVIVRCRDAGVHAGVLVSHSGRECVLKDSRRLWYWKPASRASFLSGVATEGLDRASNIGAPIDIHLTETCEIILCTDQAATSIKKAPTHEQ